MAQRFIPRNPQVMTTASQGMTIDRTYTPVTTSVDPRGDLTTTARINSGGLDSDTTTGISVALQNKAAAGGASLQFVIGDTSGQVASLAGATALTDINSSQVGTLGALTLAQFAKNAVKGVTVTGINVTSTDANVISTLKVMYMSARADGSIEQSKPINLSFDKSASYLNNNTKTARVSALVGNMAAIIITVPANSTVTLDLLFNADGAVDNQRAL